MPTTNIVDVEIKKIYNILFINKINSKRKFGEILYYL